MKYLLFVLTIFTCSSVFAEGLNISVNPLLTYHEQLKQLKQDCGALGFPPICEEKLKSITKEQMQLTEHCKTNFYDKRCQALRKKPKETTDRIDNFCADNPNVPRCQKRKERRRYLQKYLLKYCKIKPNSPRCRPKLAKKKKPSYMEKFCVEHAEEKRCVRFFERNGKAAPGAEEEGVNNLF